MPQAHPLPARPLSLTVADRERIVHGLSVLLADSFTLYLMTHNFHWNVTGPQFHGLHHLFMAQYTEQWSALDLIAERIRALGHPAPGTAHEFMQLTTLKEVAGTPSALAMLQALLDAHEGTGRTARALYVSAEAAHDPATTDLITRRLAVHEHAAWMLNSLLQA